MGKNFKTLGVGWAWETLRGVGHGTKTTYNAVSGIVGLQTAQRELQQQMAAGQLTPQQVRDEGARGAEGDGRACSGTGAISAFPAHRPTFILSFRDLQAEALMAQKSEEILSNLWKLNVMDIEKTVEKVATHVLQVSGAVQYNAVQACCRWAVCRLSAVTRGLLNRL